jgi:hypothetical protein
MNATPKRSVMFVRDNYYGFYYLSQALRRRGWDAVSVSFEAQGTANFGLIHSADIVIDGNDRDARPDNFKKQLDDIFDLAMSKYSMIYFYNGRLLSFNQSNKISLGRAPFPEDMIRLKLAGKKIGVVLSGCCEKYLQSHFTNWSGACKRCIHSTQPMVCSDISNALIGHNIHTFCDVIEVGPSPYMDFATGPKTLHLSVTSALDPEHWAPDIVVPEKYVIHRSPGEIIIFHAFGNDSKRSDDIYNVKGTPFILDAVNRLKFEGYNVRLVYANNIPSLDMRYLQVQADIVVDQLNIGYYGAAAREAMMLGRPVVGYIHQDMLTPDNRKPEWLVECPIVSAREDTVYDVLKSLVDTPERLPAIGAACRAYALKWHSADACAERFEIMYDRVMAGLPVE